MRRTGLLTTDAGLVVRSWDAGLEAMTGVPAVNAVGHPLSELCPDADRKGLLALLKESLATGGVTVLAPAIHHFLIPCKPIEPCDEFDRMQQRVVASPLSNDTSTVGLAITVEDVTPRVAAEHALARDLAAPDAEVRKAAAARLRELSGDLAGPVRTAFRDSDWQLRRRAVDAVASATDPELLQSIVAALRDGHRDFSLLSSAIRLLSLTGMDVAAALIDLLRSEDADLRIQAALALGMQSSPAVVPALLGALDDPDRNVRFHAIESLGKLQAREAVGPIAEIAERDDFFLAFPAIDALVKIGDPSVAGRIVARLADPSVRDVAAEALGTLGDEDAVPALIESLEQPGVPVGSIVRALAAIHARYEETAAAGGRIEDMVRRTLTPPAASAVLSFIAVSNGADLRAALLVLSWSRLPSAGADLARLLGRSSVPHDVIETLVRFGSPILDVLIAQLNGGAIDTRRASAVALGRLGDRAAVPALIDSLSQADTQLLAPICGALGRLGDERAFEPLLAHMGHQDPGVRQAVIGALNSIGHPQMAARIADALRDADPLVRQSAAKIAGYFGYPSTVAGLISCASDQDERVRASALEHLVYADHAQVLPTLLQAILDDTPRCRAAAAAALGHVDDPAGLDALQTALNDDDPWVRYFAASSLGRQRAVEALAALAVLATNDTAGQVRIAAIDGIGAIGGLRALACLEPLTASADTDIAAAAMRAIGGVKVPAVTGVLREGLRSADPALRIAAAQGLAAHGGTEVVESLQWTASADEDRSVVTAALAALKALASRPESTCDAVRALAAVASDPARRPYALPTLTKIPHAAVPALGSVLRSPETAMRTVVVEALGRIGRPPASALLMEALDDPHPAVRVRAIEALSRLGTRGLARRLTDIVRSDHSPDVRRIAEVALARAGGADAQRES